MPSDINTYNPYTPITVHDCQVNQVTIRIGLDGNGVVDVPTSSGTVEIVKVPGTALIILSALKTQGRGFVIYVSGPSTMPSFAVLIV